MTCEVCHERQKQSRFEEPADAYQFAQNCQEIAEDLNQLVAVYKEFWHGNVNFHENNKVVLETSLMFMSIISSWATEIEFAAQDAMEANRGGFGKTASKPPQ